MMVNHNLVGGWLVYLPLWKMMEWVRQLGFSEIPNWMEKIIQMFQSPPASLEKWWFIDSDLW